MTWQVVLSLVLILIAAVPVVPNYVGNELMAALVIVGIAHYFRGFPSVGS